MVTNEGMFLWIGVGVGLLLSSIHGLTIPIWCAWGFGMLLLIIQYIFQQDKFLDNKNVGEKGGKKLLDMNREKWERLKRELKI